MESKLHILTRKPEYSFAEDYWIRLMEAGSSLEAVYLMGAAGKALRNVGRQTTLRGTGVTQITPQEMNDSVVAERLCKLTCKGAPGGVVFCSRDRSHSELLLSHYPLEHSDACPEDFGIWFRENIRLVSRNDLYVWCFTYDADAAILQTGALCQ